MSSEFRAEVEIVDGWFRRCPACSSGGDTIYSMAMFLNVINGLNGVAPG